MAMQQKSWIKQHDGTTFFGGKGDDSFPFDVPNGYEFSGCTVQVISGRKNPGVRITDKPSVGDIHSNRKIKVHWWFDGDQRPFIKYRVTAKYRKAISTVGKDQRALLVICDLAASGSSDLKWLYEWIDKNGVNLTKTILSDDYLTVETLTKAAATKVNFLNKLSTLAADSKYKAVDTVMMLHGLEGKLYFRDGGVETNDLEVDLRNLNIKNRLRACFSTACYGASHGPALVTGGFRVACGSIGVFANGAFAIPNALSMWANGASFAGCINSSNNSAIVTASDTVAKMFFGFDEANSHWNLFGKTSTRITTLAN